MLLDKSGLRKKSEMEFPKAEVKDVRTEAEVQDEGLQARLDNVGKLLSSGHIDQAEAATVIRKIMAKKK
jgi:rhodanese-related sulfurtransferase